MKNQQNQDIINKLQIEITDLLTELTEQREQLAEYESESENFDIEEDFNCVLDDCYEDVKVFESFYSVKQILKECDPVAYRCALANHEPARLDDLKGLIQSLKDDISENEKYLSGLHTELDELKAEGGEQ